MTAGDSYQKIASLGDIPEGAVRVFELEDGQRVAVCKVEKEIFAVADLCSHDNGPLGEGELVDHEIECPRHGARFDIKTGKALCLPAVVAIPTYEVEVRGEEIWVSPKSTTAAR
jgi:3-phenylpropionate/trans-cinnamate dioxygenase ferredoxin component